MGPSDSIRSTGTTAPQWPLEHEYGCSVQQFPLALASALGALGLHSGAQFVSSRLGRRLLGAALTRCLSAPRNEQGLEEGGKKSPECSNFPLIQPPSCCLCSLPLAHMTVDQPCCSVGTPLLYN